MPALAVNKIIIFTYKDIEGYRLVYIFDNARGLEHSIFDDPPIKKNMMVVYWAS